MKTINLRLLVDDEVDATEFAKDLVGATVEPSDVFVYGVVELVDDGFGNLIPRSFRTAQTRTPTRTHADVVTRSDVVWDGQPR